MRCAGSPPRKKNQWFRSLRPFRFDFFFTARNEADADGCGEHGFIAISTWLKCRLARGRPIISPIARRRSPCRYLSLAKFHFRKLDSYFGIRASIAVMKP